MRRVQPMPKREKGKGKREMNGEQEKKKSVKETRKSSVGIRCFISSHLISSHLIGGSGSLWGGEEEII